MDEILQLDTCPGPVIRIAEVINEMFLTNSEQIKISSYGKQIICDRKKRLR